MGPADKGLAGCSLFKVCVYRTKLKLKLTLMAKQSCLLSIKYHTLFHTDKFIEMFYILRHDVDLSIAYKFKLRLIHRTCKFEFHFNLEIKQ